MYTTDIWDCDCSDGLIWDKSVIGNRDQFVLRRTGRHDSDFLNYAVAACYSRPNLNIWESKWSEQLNTGHRGSSLWVICAVLIWFLAMANPSKPVFGIQRDRVRREKPND